jgi:hypothetical protein
VKVAEVKGVVPVVSEGFRQLEKREAAGLAGLFDEGATGDGGIWPGESAESAME